LSIASEIALDRAMEVGKIVFMSPVLSPYSARLARVAQSLCNANIDALLLTPGASMFYLSGFEHGHAAERLLALIVERDGTMVWIVPSMNVEQVREKALKSQVICGWSDDAGFVRYLKAELGEAKNLAFDDEGRAGFLLDLMSAVPGAQLHKASTIMRTLRARKDADELARLRMAGGVVDETIGAAVSFCKAGLTEREVEGELRRALLAKSPGSSVAFIIVASGPNAALPHHETGNRVLRAGDVVILDFGIREAGGYHSDITVTCCVGRPVDGEVEKVYRTVWAAQDAAIKAVRAGVACEEIDRAARSVIEAAGYGKYFLHRTGHGLGLQVHEPPYMVGGNKEVLEEGMVFSIEPGIYLPGRFGVRLEIIASVGREGVSLINRQSAEMMPSSAV
jgi:Xaa-Pro aminopeptidase